MSLLHSIPFRHAKQTQQALKFIVNKMETLFNALNSLHYWLGSLLPYSTKTVQLIY